VRSGSGVRAGEVHGHPVRGGHLPGGFTCACKSGFAGDGVSCTDVDECASNHGGCAATADCINVPGSYTCRCREGFTGSGFACADVDECTAGNGGCDPNADCGNQFGAPPTCTCQAGFSGDGQRCVPALTNLDACGALLAPAFDSTTYQYAASVPYLVDQCAVSASASGGGLTTLQVGGQPSGALVDLAVGANALGVRAVAPVSGAFTPCGLQLSRAVELQREVFAVPPPSEPTAAVGETVAQGADLLSLGSPSSGNGVVHLFRRVNGVFVRERRLAGTAVGDRFGEALAYSGGKLFVGAPGRKVITGTGDVVPGAGVVFVYERDAAGAWQVSATLNSDMPQVNQQAWPDHGFGSRLSAASNTLSVGAPDAYSGNGTAYVFSTWGGQRYLNSADSPGGPSYGAAFAHDPLTRKFVVGNRGGKVYSHELRQNAPPSQLLTDAQLPGAPYDGFGRAVVTVGKWLLVGAERDSALSGAGGAFLCERVGGQWQPTQELGTSNPALGLAFPRTHRFGAAVALAGNRAVVADPLADGDSGALYAYELDAAGTWSLQRRVQPLLAAQVGGPVRLGERFSLVPGRLLVGVPTLPASVSGGGPSVGAGAQRGLPAVAAVVRGEVHAVEVQAQPGEEAGDELARGGAALAHGAGDAQPGGAGLDEVPGALDERAGGPRCRASGGRCPGCAAWWGPG